jgi:hypothetical protein
MEAILYVITLKTEWQLLCTTLKWRIYGLHMLVRIIIDHFCKQ